MLHTKFLTFAVNEGKINRAARDAILKLQRAARMRNEDTRVGDLAVQHHYIDERTRDDLLKAHRERQQRRLSRVRDIVTDRPGLRLQQLLVAIVSAIGVVIAVAMFSVKINIATSVASFTAFVIITFLQYKVDQSLPLSVVKIGKIFLIVLLSALVAFAAFSLWNLSRAFTLAPNATNTDAIALWLHRVQSSFALLVGGLLTLALYSFWKFQSQRFVEARIGAMKDIMLRVEAILRQRDRMLSEEDDESKTKREELEREALERVLNGLRNTLRLNASDRLLRAVKRVLRQKVILTVWFYLPDNSANSFVTRGVAYPEDAPESARKAFEWVRANHHPPFLNEEKFEYWKEVAKGMNPKGWKTRYLNTKERYEYVSVCGWIFSKQGTLISRNASQCLVFNDSYRMKMEEKGIGKKEAKWVEIGSFVGCRVIGFDDRPLGVLLAMKNVKKGLSPEDLEVVVIAAQMLGRIVRA